VPVVNIAGQAPTCSMLQVFDAPAEILLREAFAADREPTFKWQ
jgi:hypothetical protein